ncbi:hypothetical protein DSM21852_15650 [Methylocystis bryophila]|uniref:Uncharacterized protein n=2 Tax=Methylocystis bryophila TaxID=655015 RepID=A0A1W6MXC9_9HYPH|nr:hypothetical protein B1812_15020 [Methylocystis bryophila]BDV38312.1 hypothetical protein DSM21852_15650 [Methylocystis bryophila]
MPNIRFPDMRMNVLGNLEALADREHQERCWVRHEAYDCFDEVIHALFDDSSFEDGPRSAVGALLFEEGEADRIKTVMDLIDALFAKYGKKLSDKGYMATPEWPAIIAAAKQAFEAMKQNDLRFMAPGERQELYDRYKIPS